MVLKGLKKMLAMGVVLAGGLAFGVKDAGAEGRLEVYNMSPAAGVNDNYIRFKDSDGNAGYTPNLQPSMETWYEDDNSNTYWWVGSVGQISKTYKCPLQYGSSVPNGATNYIAYIPVSGYAFPSNILFTSLADVNGKLRPADVRKKIVERGGVSGREYLDNVPVGHSDWQIYGTNYVNISPIETTVTNSAANSDGQTATLSARARPGTVLWPEYKDDIASTNGWTAMTNKFKYLGPDTTNFGNFGSVSWTNLPLGTNMSRFFRIGNSCYDSTSSNKLAQSEQ